MKLYRGQAYGVPIGQWWTTNRKEAGDYARSRGGRAWVVLAVDVAVRKVRGRGFDRIPTNLGTVYRIPVPFLRRQALAVRIVDGFLEVPAGG